MPASTFNERRSIEAPRRRHRRDPPRKRRFIARRSRYERSSCDGGHRFDLLVLERASAGKRRPTGLEVAASDEPFVFAAQTYEGSLIVLGCKLALAVPTVQQAWASSGVRAGDRIVAVNGTAGPAEKLLSLLRRDNKKRRLTLVRPQTEESMGWRDSVRARRKLFV